MKAVNVFMIVFVSALSLTSNIWPAVKVNEILQSLDKLMEIGSDVSAKVKFTQQLVGQGVKEFESFYYRRDSDDSFLIVMTAPDSEIGNGYLRVGDNFWMYRQNTRTFQHINRDESISGTEMRGGDFEKRKMLDLYTAILDEDGNESVTKETLGNIPVYRFEITAIVNDVTYPKQIYWVRQDNYLPLKVQSFSLSDTLMMTSYYLKYTTIEGRYISVKQISVDEFEVGNKTIMEISGISMAKLDDSIFTKAYLENLSR